MALTEQGIILTAFRGRRRYLTLPPERRIYAADGHDQQFLPHKCGAPLTLWLALGAGQRRCVCHPLRGGLVFLMGAVPGVSRTRPPGLLSINPSVEGLVLEFEGKGRAPLICAEKR